MTNFERVPAEAAFKVLMNNKSNATPRLDKCERLDPYASPTIRPSFQLAAGENVFTMGSCFARNIEHALLTKGFVIPLAQLTVPSGETHDTWKNAKGLFNKYTPFSMINEIKSAFMDVDPNDFLLETEKGWMDLQLHTDKFVTHERALERRDQINELIRVSISQCRIIIITLGLVEAWFDNFTGWYTNQTPTFAFVKANPRRFSFEVLSPDMTTGAVNELISILKKYGRPDQRLLLTVSPVPIGRTFTNQDAMVANTYSKAALRVAAEMAVDSNAHVDYFPSYESVTLSDRQIAWEDDGIHVKPAIVRYNVERMLASYTAEASNPNNIAVVG